MKVQLEKEVHKPIIIHGFPTFGLIGSIITEYLIEYYHCEKIGSIQSAELAPMVAIHDGKLIEPISLFYNEEKNILIVHAIGEFTHVEYKLAQAIVELVEKTESWELISFEGIADPRVQAKTELFGIAQNTDLLAKTGIQSLDQGVIMGVCAALLLNLPPTVRHSLILATTHSKLPDSHAAIVVLEKLAQYLELHIDSTPLQEQAKVFEQKMQSIMRNTQTAQKEKREKTLSYVG